MAERSVPCERLDASVTPEDEDDANVLPSELRMGAPLSAIGIRAIRTYQDGWWQADDGPFRELALPIRTGCRVSSFMIVNTSAVRVNQFCWLYPSNFSAIDDKSNATSCPSPGRHRQ